MRASWSVLYTSLSATLNRISAETAFTAMRQACPELHRFHSIASVMEHQRNPSTDAATRFGVVRTLVAVAQSEHGYRSTAQIMVIVALWPGLDAVFWRLWRGFPEACDDLPGEILARIGEAIQTLDLQRVTAIAATLLLNVKRDICRDLIRARLLAENIRQIDDSAFEAQTSMLVWRGTFEAGSIHDHLDDLAPRDATFLERVFVRGETQEEAGRALGLSPAAARKRFQRSLKKLRSSQN
jgi:DNA-directed RNA polymerase specialized sigma24 family protein